MNLSILNNINKLKIWVIFLAVFENVQIVYYVLFNITLKTWQIQIDSRITTDFGIIIIDLVSPSQLICMNPGNIKKSQHDKLFGERERVVVHSFTHAHFLITTWANSIACTLIAASLNPDKKANGQKGPMRLSPHSTMRAQVRFQTNVSCSQNWFLFFF